MRSSAVQRHYLRNMTGLAVLISILTSSALSASRIYGMLLNYSAPMHTWAQLPKAYNELQAREQQEAGPGNAKSATGPRLACVGAEWHRFPSSFFLPEGVELAFVEAGFDGVLRVTAASIQLIVCLQTAAC
jgi:alpha-1,2-mannosyltransferase